MKIVNEKPPIWASVKTLLDFNEDTTIFTYGDTIYNPSGLKVTDDLIAHEEVHMRQQEAMGVMGKFGPVLWWKKYLKDPAFRLEQETEAYRAQYKYAKEHMNNRELLAEYLHFLAIHLSGVMYGKVIGFNEAMRRIKQ